MTLTTAQIDEIAEIVSEGGFWGDGREIFRRLGLPKSVSISGGVQRRMYGYLEHLEGAAAEAALRYFEVGSHRDQCAPWPRRGLKLFVSHRDDQKANLAKLADQLERVGIAPFLAHQAIELGKTWRDELTTGLRTMDSLFAYCSEGFSQSDWCGQEVGFAFGRDVPVLAVMAGEPLKGLLEPIQMAKATVTSDEQAGRLAEMIFEHLHKDPRVKGPLSEGLARRLKFVGVFASGRAIAERLLKVGVVTERARADIIDALRINNQTEDVLRNDEFLAMAGVAELFAEEE